MERRDFIKMLGLAGTSATAYAACSSYMREALAQSTSINELLSTAAHCQSGSLKDVEHVILLMQENRSFDHYYGTLRGVRGFGDPRPLRLKSGVSVFDQPRAPLLSSFSYSFNNVSWDMIEAFVAPFEPAQLKRLLKEQIDTMFPTAAPTVTPLIDTMPNGFLLRVLRSDWDSLLPPEMAGNTIPELLEKLKDGLVVLKPEDIDPTFADIVKNGVMSLFDNKEVLDLIGKALPEGGFLKPDMIKGMMEGMPAQQVVAILVGLVASLIKIDELKASWPSAVAILPSLGKGLPNLAELFYWLQGLSQQFAASPAVGMLPQNPALLLSLLPADITKYIPEDIKAQYPKLVASLKGEGHIKPFQVQRGTDSAGEYKSFGLPHAYDDQRDAINHGWNDQWMLTKGEEAMAHLDVAKDLSFYHKLVDAFTICDEYHCSSHTGTDSNRTHFYSGTANGWTNNLFFSGGKTVPDWKTYPETLQNLGVSWKCYQDGLGEDLFLGNFGDNLLEDFKQYKVAGSEIAKHALIVNTILRTDADVPSQLEKDIAEGTLPAVSWIAAPQAFCEHPSGISPHFGEYYVNQILKALAANPEVWKKTVFIINYDENDGFFDHVPPPLPPLPSVHDVGKVSDGIETQRTASMQNMRRNWRRSLSQQSMHAIRPSPRIN
ncbi:alkaline phosphatase family protein [Phyllobacterium sp. P5_D12]